MEANFIPFNNFYPLKSVCVNITNIPLGPTLPRYVAKQHCVFLTNCPNNICMCVIWKWNYNRIRLFITASWASQMRGNSTVCSATIHSATDPFTPVALCKYIDPYAWLFNVATIFSYYTYIYGFKRLFIPRRIWFRNKVWTTAAKPNKRRCIPVRSDCRVPF